jgi:hypothetical protein
MKISSKEEEQAHYNEVLKGGFIGGSLFLGLGLAGVWGASRRYPAFLRSTTLPFRAFLVTSSATFGAIINAERRSNDFHMRNNPMNFYKDETENAIELARQQETPIERFTHWSRKNRYSIVFGSWIAAMGLALGMVGCNKYLSTSQKLVQARMYAQGLTLAVLVATATIETSDARGARSSWETIKVPDPHDHKKLIERRVHREEYEGQDLWKDMVASEERRLQDQATSQKAAHGKKDDEKQAAN